MVRRRTLLAAASGALLGSVVNTGTARADETVTVLPGTDHGQWEGWGTSLAWWATVFGQRNDFADLFFTTKSVTYNGRSLPGLGLNIARYNLGACSWNSVAGETMVASPNIPRFKQVEGYWQDWHSEDPASSAWNWNADATQRAALVKASERGAITELFANSPMWWMCLNHNPSGAADGGNNLQPWNYRQFAVHLATTARYAADHWGVRFATVEPFNEPSSTWWRADGTQEGCHIDAAVQRTVLGHLRAELDARGLTGTRISASDETSYDLARTTWGGFDASTRSLVDQVNVHGYQGSGGRRDLLYADVRAAGKKLWNSETGDSDGTGLTLATNLCLDFRWLHPTAWCYWQVMDPSPGWALIHYSPDTLQPGAVQTKLYVLAQFTRHIRPGMRILETGSDHAVAAYDPAARRLVIVAVNPGAAQNLTFDLSRFGQVSGGTGGLVPRWNTLTSGTGDRYTAHQDTYLTGKQLRVSFAAQSVQTFQVDGVSV
ncbi:glycoside hydrolase [Goodfellowiella coeruleoviolacea]|uniref:Galactan endo-1,6-beta-galactosidase n=1 Tax=Goodfellowiella coeruleoviolacea TaxID=334858 RepID=A0AAE3G9T5_9PSEU|nr:glycoside hydrolase [Goodfellowiella coeruleoviolacea]MCP2164306.1 galactan endo-1,6-beta-galactosidase [Goodfellowiella coeruleoviolacea]